MPEPDIEEHFVVIEYVRIKRQPTLLENIIDYTPTLITIARLLPQLALLRMLF